MSCLNVVALISGGKDSLFSILHCQSNGHKVIALANLHPPRHNEHEVPDDTDSYMYQTIGHAVVPLYEQALGLPLYRQEITGDATMRARDYAADEAGDETESLMPLLRKVLDAHPEVNAVSTGAILSDYQRTRVESVALRLGLTPLSYLWQYPSLPPQTQCSLLEDMAAVHQDSRIIKVASGGLDETFLWQNVADPRTIAKLTKASQRFGSPGDGAVLGEGGEFETLALSGPPQLWKFRIDVPQEGIKVERGEAGSAFVRILSPRVVPRVESAAASCPSMPRIPPVLEPRFADILHEVEEGEASDSEQELQEPSSSLEMIKQNAGAQLITTLDNVAGQGTNAAEQTRSIMEQIKVRLATSDRNMDEITYSIIVLRTMDDFTSVNNVYGSYFARPNPPARITVACADVLEPETLLTISITCADGSREGLHVQSRSYWAPANIGPYSQAIRVSSNETTNASVYIAGQIPLEPASMHLPAPSGSRISNFARQSVLALQHLHRIGEVMKVHVWTYGIVFIASVGLDEEELSRRAALVRHTWRASHNPTKLSTATETDEDETFDVWDLKHGSGKPWLAHMQSASLIESGNHEPIGIPQLVVLTADTLPRDAEVEWVGFGGTGIVPGIPVHLYSLLRTFQRRF